MSEIADTNRPSLSEFDLSAVSKPTDGILYCYESAVDGLWYVTADADVALQEATGYPVGELVEYEADGWTDPQEHGKILSMIVGGRDE